MQVCSATVRLGGLLTQTVFKEGLTPAEVIVLRGIHGDDSVVGINVTGSAKNADVGKEKARLVSVYGKPRVEAVFPGARPDLPQTFEQIAPEEEPDEYNPAEDGPGEGVIADVAPARRGPGRPRKEEAA
jgi:hypothetical protein